MKLRCCVSCINAHSVSLIRGKHLSFLLRGYRYRYFINMHCIFLYPVIKQVEHSFGWRVHRPESALTDHLQEQQESTEAPLGEAGVMYINNQLSQYKLFFLF